MRNEYHHNNDGTTTIFLYGNRETTISTLDFDKVNNFPYTWGSIYHKQTKQYRAYGGIYLPGNKRENHYLHRWIMEAPKGKVVDHVNHNSLDNRRENLRIVTFQQNQQNQSGLQSHNKSGFRNVCFDPKSNKYRAYVRIDGKQKHLGYFKTAEEANKVAVEARKEYMPYSTT